VTNQGPDNATNVTVLDQLPSSYTYVSSSPAGLYNPATGVWTVGNVNVGATAMLSITATIDDFNDIVNVAEILAADQPDIDSTPGNGADTNGNGDIGPIDPDGSQDPLDEDDGDDAFPLPEAIDLELTKSINVTSATVGDIVTFTIVVTNQGPDIATNVMVNDQLPSSYTYISDNSAGAYNPATGDWVLGTVPVGGVQVLSIQLS